MGRIAIVTGAASGMGRRAVEVFASEGALVTAFDVKAEALSEVAAAAKATTAAAAKTMRPQRDLSAA